MEWASRATFKVNQTDAGAVNLPHISKKEGKTMKKYYVTHKALIGKQFYARSYVLALAYAHGFADAKGWSDFTLKEVN